MTRAAAVPLHRRVERWLSGRKRTTRNRLKGNLPWVRIPPSPFPEQKRGFPATALTSAFSALPSHGRCGPVPGGRPRRREGLALAAPLPAHQKTADGRICALGPIPGFRPRPPATSAMGRTVFSLKRESIPVMPSNAARITAGADTPSSPFRPLRSTGTPPRPLAPAPSATAMTCSRRSTRTSFLRVSWLKLGTI